MIAFKNPGNVCEFSDCHTMLKEILFMLHTYWPKDIMVITRIFTPRVEGESGVHESVPHRAADVRTNDLSETEGRSLQDIVNSFYDYGDGKHAVALQHGEGPNRHLHLQVRPGNETRARA